MTGYQEKASQLSRCWPSFWPKRLQWIVANPLGKPLEVSNMIRRSFRPILEKAGLPQIRFHDLRHSCERQKYAFSFHVYRNAPIEWKFCARVQDAFSCDLSYDDYQCLLYPFLPAIALSKLAASPIWQLRYLIALHENTQWKMRQRLCQDGNCYVCALARTITDQISFFASSGAPFDQTNAFLAKRYRP